MSLKNVLLGSVVMFSLLSIFLFVQHEFDMIRKALQDHNTVSSSDSGSSYRSSLQKGKELRGTAYSKDILKNKFKAEKPTPVKKIDDGQDSMHKETGIHFAHTIVNPTPFPTYPPTTPPTAVNTVSTNTDRNSETQEIPAPAAEERKGILTCNGKQVDSEVIYWKIVPGDDNYESPITPHHENHHDRYLSFEYDNGGWNNVRMGLECLIVVAHAMGRTLVVPPQQHLYLLGRQHKDAEDTEAHDEMGFEDFFDLDVLRSHKGYHVLHMEEFLAKEGVSGGLKGKLPPGNSTEAWGPKLWKYLESVADENPEWSGKFLAMPESPGDFNLNKSFSKPEVIERFKRFAGSRSPFFYDERLQNMHHIHVPGDSHHRILQHHYAFVFFADSVMQSFYRRFVRDFMRYKDDIQCAGSDLVATVRAEARHFAPHDNGEYYALHIRRGDLQFKDVKIGAQEMLDNLKFLNGTSIIPPNSFVYISTDDPQGICKGCTVLRKPCDEYPKGSKPVGCPEDPSWNAFIKFGWKIRFLDDYLKQGMLKGVNPNKHGMVESIVCSRAKAFAGTYYSTFTGYIHRLRGYHGLGESTYYHAKKFVLDLQMKKSVGHGWPREWRAGWTDDGGDLI